MERRDEHNMKKNYIFYSIDFYNKVGLSCVGRKEGQEKSYIPQSKDNIGLSILNLTKLQLVLKKVL